MYKIRTLVEKKNSPYAHQNEYTFCGRFLRKYRIDELPQIWNMIRRDMAICGPRPEEMQTIILYPEHIRRKLLSVKPGLFGLSGIHFLDEEKLLASSKEPARDYWLKIRPTKLALDMFYIENKCFLLDIAVIYMAIKKRLLT